MSMLRNLFNWFSLMLFFYNGVTGFVTALQRILISTVLGLLLLFRLDRVVVAKGFDFLDIGMPISNILKIFRKLMDV